jgi:hypothetical protein
MKPELKKKNVTIKLYPELISRIEKAMERGYKKNFIIEKGIELHLDKIENEQKILTKAGI